MTTITLRDTGGRVWEAGVQEVIRIIHDSHSSYSWDAYKSDLMSEFKITDEEAEKELKQFFQMK